MGVALAPLGGMGVLHLPCAGAGGSGSPRSKPRRRARRSLGALVLLTLLGMLASAARADLGDGIEEARHLPREYHGGSEVGRATRAGLAEETTMRWTLSRKTYASFVVVGSLAEMAIGFGVYAMNDARVGAERIRDELVRMKAANDLQLQVANLWQFYTDASLTQSAESVQEATSAKRVALEDVAALRDRAVATEGLDEVTQLVERIDSIGRRMMAAYGASDAEGDRVMEEYDVVCGRAIDAVATLAQNVEVRASAAHAATLGRLTRATWIGCTLGCVRWRSSWTGSRSASGGGGAASEGVAPRPRVPHAAPQQRLRGSEGETGVVAYERAA